MTRAQAPARERHCPSSSAWQTSNVSHATLRTTKFSLSLPLSTPTGAEKGRGGFKTRPYPAWLTKFINCLPSGRPYDTIFLNRSVRIFSPLDSAGVWPTEALTLARRSLVGGWVLKMPLEAPAPLASMVVRRITMALGS